MAPRPQIRFEAISKAFDLLRANFGVWLGAGVVSILASVVALVVTMGPGFLLFLEAGRPGRSASESLVPMLLGYLLMTVGFVAYYGLYSVAYAGMYRMALRQIDGERIEIGDMFRLEGTFWQHFGASLLGGLIISIGMFLCYIPGLIAAGLLMFSGPLIMDRQLGAVTALRQSYETLRNEVWMALLFIFVLGLLASLGAYLCLVGIFVTWPMYPLAIAVAYREFFPKPGGEVAPASPGFPAPPPVVG